MDNSKLIKYCQVGIGCSNNTIDLLRAIYESIKSRLKVIDDLESGEHSVAFLCNEPTNPLYSDQFRIGCHINDVIDEHNRLVALQSSIESGTFAEVDRCHWPCITTFLAAIHAEIEDDIDTYLSNCD
jgi:hypothetical protein